MSHISVICQLTSMTAKVVTEHPKAIFSEHGVPDVLVSDNVPCYTGKYFKAAMSKLGITHITTSPHHHQSNGLAEGNVQIVKNLLSKAKETREDYHEVISVYCNTNLWQTIITIWTSTQSKAQAGSSKMGEEMLITNRRSVQ